MFQCLPYDYVQHALHIMAEKNPKLKGLHKAYIYEFSRFTFLEIIMVKFPKA